MRAATSVSTATSAEARCGSSPTRSTSRCRQALGAVVLDNTYLTRAARSYVIEAASRHRVRARCVWLDTPLAQAQVNLVERLLDRFGSLPTPEELRSWHGASRACSRRPRRCARFASSSRPSADEGFAAVEQVPFERGHGVDRPRHGRVSSSRPPR